MNVRYRFGVLLHPCRHIPILGFPKSSNYRNHNLHFQNILPTHSNDLFYSRDILSTAPTIRCHHPDRLQPDTADRDRFLRHTTLYHTNPDLEVKTQCLLLPHRHCSRRAFCLVQD